MPLTYRIQDLIDIPKLKSLLDSLYHVASGIPAILLDLDGNILAGSGLQDIRAKFHRVNHRSECLCLASHQAIIKGLSPPGSHKQITCPHGLTDVATPLIIEGQHLATIFTGQFLLTQPDRERFRQQAREFGFDEEDYLTALDQVPVISQQRLDHYLAFIANLVESLVIEGLKELRNIEARQGLLENEFRLGIALEAARAGTWDWDLVNNRIQWDKEFPKLFGMDPSVQPSFDGWRTCLHPEDRDAAVQRVEDALTQGRDLINEYRIIQPDGEIRWIKAVGKTFHRDRVPVRMLGLCMDITASKQTEEALRERETQYRNLANSGLALVWTSGPDKLCNYFNDPWLKFTGRTLAEEIGNGWAQGVHPDDFDRCLTTYATAFDKRESFDIEYRLRHRSGEYRWLHDVGTPNFNSSGEFVGYIGHCLDITKQKLAEEALLESESSLALAAQIAHVGYWDRDYISGIGKWSAETYRIFGHETGVDRGEGTEFFSRHVHPDDRAAVDQATDDAWRGIRPFDLEYRIIRPDGTIRHIHSRGELVRNGDGKPLRLFGIVADITGTKQSEAALRESEAKHRLLFDSAGDAIFIHDVNLVMLAVNARACEQLGYTHAELMSMAIDQIKTPAEARLTPERNARLLAQGHLTFETVYQGKDGSLIPIEVSARRITWDGQPAIMNICRDITLRKQEEKERAMLQAQLNQAQKMESIGILAGGIAHDFNNILGIILGYAEMAKDDAAPGSQLAQDLDRVLTSAHRAKDLVKQILAFSRQATVHRIPIKIQPLVKETLKMLRASLPSTITIEENIQPQGGAVLADPTEVHQIVMNLCTNAFHAMEKTGGALSVGVKTTTMEYPRPVAPQQLSPGEYIDLTVSDTGSGIGPDIIEKIFDPYFTTKEMGRGTGLGLSISHGIIKSYGGAITVETALGQGTSFHVFLPVIQEEDKESAASQEAPRGKGLILFVDDEELLVEMGRHMLERLGYTVTSRCSSIEALEAFMNNPGQFDLVITDQTMPGMTGTDLARKMLRIRPDLPIILCTGFSNLIDEESAKAIGIREFALKPLTKSSIGQLIRKLLPSKGSQA